MAATALPLGWKWTELECREPLEVDASQSTAECTERSLASGACRPRERPVSGLHAVQLSGEMRTLNYTWHSIYNHLIRPNGMDLFAELLYDDADPGQAAMVSRLRSLPLTKALHAEPYSTMFFADKKCTEVELPNYDQVLYRE